MDISHLSYVGLVKIFFLFYRLLFCHLDSVLCLKKLFSFMRSYLSFFVSELLVLCLESCLLWESHFLFYQIYCNLFMLTLLIHLDLSFMQGNMYESICFPLHTDIQLEQHHLLNILYFSSPLFGFDFFVKKKNQVSWGMGVYFLVFDSSQLMNLSCFYASTIWIFTIALKYSLRSGIVLPPEILPFTGLF